VQILPSQLKFVANRKSAFLNMHFGYSQSERSWYHYDGFTHSMTFGLFIRSSRLAIMSKWLANRDILFENARSLLLSAIDAFWLMVSCEFCQVASFCNLWSPQLFGIHSRSVSARLTPDSENCRHLAILVDGKKETDVHISNRLFVPGEINARQLHKLHRSPFRQIWSSPFGEFEVPNRGIALS
jgi:hypothetical protein